MSLNLGRGVLALMLAMAGAGVGCRGVGPSSSGGDHLVVFAAASLREVFTDMTWPFRQAHPGVEVTFNFAGTQELRAQLEQGAPADVFASADQKHMDELVRAARVVAPVVFARNEPVVVVAQDDGGAIRSFAELPSVDRLVVGVPEVPIGRYTLQILDRASAALGADFRARVEKKIVSREHNVRQALAKVTLGEAQAGIVYRTDARTVSDKVSVVPIPPAINVIAEYPIAVVAGAAHADLARAWVAFVLSSEGRRRLQGAGFLVPAS